MAQTKKEEKLLEYVVFIAAGYFLIINPILKKLGIKKSELETAPDTTAPSKNVWAGKPFLDSLQRPYTLIKEDTKKILSQSIFDALPTYWVDDPNTIIGIFRSLKTKSQVADLAQYFKQDKKYDLYDFLKHGRSRDLGWSSTTGGLNSSNLNTVLTLVKAKPDRLP